MERKYKRCAPIDGKKPIWVIVEDGKIIDYSPSKEELIELKEEPYDYHRITYNDDRKYSGTDICDNCKKEKLFSGKAFKEYIEGKWTKRWICNKCYMRQYNAEHKFWDIFRPIANCRTNNQNPDHSNTKGDKFQKLTCIWKSVNDLNIEHNNCISPIDHSPSPEGIIYQTKGKFYDEINRWWTLNCQNEHDKNFDFLIFYCTNKDGKYIERIYIFPKEYITKRKTVTIYKNPSKGYLLYEKYRVKDDDTLKCINEKWDKIK